MTTVPYLDIPDDFGVTDCINNDAVYKNAGYAMFFLKGSGSPLFRKDNSLFNVD